MLKIFQLFVYVFREFIAKIRNIFYLYNKNQLTLLRKVECFFSMGLFIYEAIFFVILSLVKPEKYQLDLDNKIWVSWRQGIYKLLFIFFCIFEIGMIFPISVILYRLQLNGRYKAYSLFSNNFLNATNPSDDLNLNKAKHLIYIINRANYNSFDDFFNSVIMFIFRMHMKVYAYDSLIEFRYVDTQEIINVIIEKTDTPLNPYPHLTSKLLLLAIEPTYVDNALISSNLFKNTLEKIMIEAFSEIEDPNITMSFLGYEVGGAYFTLITEILLSNPDYKKYIDRIKNIYFIESTVYLFTNLVLPKNKLNFHQIFGINDYTSNFPLNIISPIPKLNGNLKVVPIQYYNVAIVQYLSVFTVPDVYQYIINNDILNKQ